MYEDNICRICLEHVHSNLVKPCACTHGNFHIDCFLKWVNISGKTHCEICLNEYDYIHIKKYRNIKAIIFFTLASLCIQFMLFYWIYLLRDIYSYEGYETYSLAIYGFIFILYLTCNILLYYCIKNKYKFSYKKVEFKYEQINPLIEIPQVY